MRNRKDPKIEVNIDRFDFTEVEESMVAYEDMYISSEVYLSKVLIGNNGLIAFLPVEKEPTDNKELKEIISQIENFFGISRYLYIVFVSEDRAWFSYSLKEFHEIEDMEDFLIHILEVSIYQNCSALDVENHFDDYMSIELDVEEDLQKRWNKPNITESVLDAIFEKCEWISGRERPSDTVYEDNSGQIWVLKNSDIQIGPVNTGLIGKKKWFRLSHIPADKAAFYTAFGGWMGFHQFLFGNMAQGFLYLITCGFGGILPAMDIFLMLMGNFSYTDISYEDTGNGNYKQINEKVFLERPANKVKYVILMIISVLIGLSASAFIYSKVLRYLSIGMGMLGTSIEKSGMF